MTVKTLVAALALVAAACGGSDTPAKPIAADPERGATILAATCAKCHGPDASGTDQGPPLVDPIYRPGHHADAAFLLAVRRGVPQHHWNFGTMPPQPDVTEQDVRDITAYVRQLQQQAGID